MQIVDMYFDYCGLSSMVNCQQTNHKIQFEYIMLSKKNDSDRFAKVLTKLNTASQKTETQKHSNQTSFLQDMSMRSDKSTKYGSQIEARSTTQMDEPRALKLLLEEPEVLINRQVVKLRTEFVPTSNGMRFIILIGEALINLSWLHSVQQLQPGKILLLYYDMKGIGEGKAKMQSLILQVGRTQGSALCSALTLIHGKYHDDEVEKVYHFLC